MYLLFWWEILPTEGPVCWNRGLYCRILLTDGLVSLHYLFGKVIKVFISWQLVHLLMRFLVFLHQYITHTFQATGCFSTKTLHQPISERRMTHVIMTCQKLERMLAELGFKLTTPGLMACIATDWATGARHFGCQGWMICWALVWEK